MIARSTVIASHPETPSSHTVRIARPPGFQFRPVQFVGLEIRTADGSEEYSMSLASSPTRDYLEFGARLSDSPWKRAFRALQPGDEVEIDGPYGHFVLDEARPAILIAGGIGITPLKGMLQYATDRKLPIPIRLLYSNRTVDEIAYRDEIDALVARNPRAEVVYTLTRPQEGTPWEGRVGRIDEALLTETAANLAEPVYYLCGTPGLVSSMIQTLRDLGIPRGRVVWEEFWGY